MVIDVLQSHGCSIEGADKPISGADPACQVSIAHLGGFCNCDFSRSTYFEIDNFYYCAHCCIDMDRQESSHMPLNRTLLAVLAEKYVYA